MLGDETADCDLVGVGAHAFGLRLVVVSSFNPRAGTSLLAVLKVRSRLPDANRPSTACDTPVCWLSWYRVNPLASMAARIRSASWLSVVAGVGVGLGAMAQTLQKSQYLVTVDCRPCRQLGFQLGDTFQPNQLQQILLAVW
jgi:hypothetical protein